LKVTERAEVKQFLSEVWNEDTLSVLMRTHLRTESKLIRLLEQCLPNPKALDIDRMRFSNKVEFVSALNLITEHATRALKMLNKLRNRFAHNLEAEIKQADVDALLLCFEPTFQQKLKVKAQEAVALKQATHAIDILALRLRVCLIAVDAHLLGNVDASLKSTRKL
jgi:hypothetical protein